MASSWGGPRGVYTLIHVVLLLSVMKAVFPLLVQILIFQRTSNFNFGPRKTQ